MIEVKNENFGKVRVRLFETHGRPVLNKTYSKSASYFKEVISVGHLIPGVYLLELTLPGQARPVVMQLIKQ